MAVGRARDTGSAPSRPKSGSDNLRPMRNAHTQTAATRRPISRREYERHLAVYLLTNLCLESDLSRQFERLRLPEPAPSRKSA